MISKELLTEVYTGKYIILGKVWIDEDNIRFKSLNNCSISNKINKYKFAHMCKEWALRKNYILASESNTYGGICNMSISSIDIDVFYNIQSTTRANTEVEAVIKACEWILNNKDRK